MKIFSVLLLSMFFAFNVHADTTCDAGYYLDGGVCTACPAGYYCTGSTATKTACPLGTYNDTAGATDESACKAIENGKYGTDCNYSLGGRFPTYIGCASSKDCPNGYVDGAAAVGNIDNINKCQIKTTPGKYVDVAGAGLAPCPAGSYCPGDILVSYDSTGGVGECIDGTPSDDGTKCGCGADKYQDGNVCTACPVNMHNVTSYATECTPCPIGTERTADQTECTPCAMGYYNDTPGAACTYCPVGTYNDTTGATGESACKTIEPGTYGVECNAGRFKGSGCIGAVECPAGYYCPGGEPDKNACPVGTYNDKTGATTELQCKAIAPGMYTAECDGTDAGSGCADAYYCPYPYRDGPGVTNIDTCQVKTKPGTYVKTPGGGLVPCPDGAYCPGGIIVNYDSTGGLDGDIDDGICVVGYYCPGGIPENKTACPVGTYNDTTSATDVSQCKDIPDGNYGLNCGVGGRFPLACATYELCPDGYRDDIGVNRIGLCKIKTTPGMHVETAMAGLSSCPAGYYCPGNSFVSYGSIGGNIACSSGTYNDAIGATDSSACKDVPDGNYASNCTSGSAACTTYELCPDGYRDGAGATDINSCQVKTTPGTYVETAGAGLAPCLAGAYCPGGIMVNYNATGGIAACPTGTYMDSDTSLCLEIGIGKYCNNIIEDVYTGDLACAGITDCPDGYRDGPGAMDINGCQIKTMPDTYVATAGGGLVTGCPQKYFYCPGNVMVNYNTPGGYLSCPDGTYLDSDTSECVEIGRGRYCNEATYDVENNRIACAGVTDCPDGYRDGAGATDINACQIKTTPGMYVAVAGAGLASCPKGYYCTGDVMINYNATGGNTPCMDSKYSDVGATDKSQCTEIAPGYECTEYVRHGTSYYSPKSCVAFDGCPVGYYCAGGTATKTKCPRGTYSDTIGAMECKVVIPGYYATGCITGGRFPTYDTCTGIAECPAGYRDGPGATDINKCQVKTAPGTHVATVGAGLVSCPVLHNCPGGIMVSYDTIGGHFLCDNGWNTNTGECFKALSFLRPDGTHAIKVLLDKTKRTTPALATRIDGVSDIYYANMVPANERKSNHVYVSYGNSVYELQDNTGLDTND